MDEPNLRQSQDEMSLVDKLPWMNLRIQKGIFEIENSIIHGSTRLPHFDVT